MDRISYPFEHPPAPEDAIQVAPGVQWIRMPLPLKLDHINLYLLEDGDGWFIVDTGIQGEETQALWERIFARHLGDKPVKGVVVTHSHPDHIGLAGWLVERWRVPFWITRAEYYSTHYYAALQGYRESWHYQDFFRRAGLTAEQTHNILQRLGSFGKFIAPVPPAYRRIEHGDCVGVNGQRWRVICSRGHSREHACFYSDSLGLLISVDQVLPRISSNVGVFPSEPEANPMESWLESLRALQSLPENTLVLPAHNSPFYGLHRRLRALIDHHHKHLEALEQACGTPKTIMELLPVLFKRSLGSHEIMLALGEAVAHVHFLMHQLRLERHLDDEGVYRYTRVAADGMGGSQEIASDDEDDILLL